MGGALGMSGAGASSLWENAFIFMVKCLVQCLCFRLI